MTTNFAGNSPAPDSVEPDSLEPDGDIFDGHTLDTPVDLTAGHPRRWAILVVLCASLAIVIIGNTSLNVALPAISGQLGASNSQLQWIVDAYGLVFAGLLLAAGTLGDRYGRKGALQFGLAVFLAGSLAAAMMDGATGLIICRAIMGVGAAFVMPATLSIIANIFPPHERPKAIALWAGIAGAGGAVGPVASGLLLEHYSWASVFLVNVPVIIAALIGGAILVPKSRDHLVPRVDWTGALLSIVGVSAVVYAIIEAPAHGWLSVQTLGVFAGAFLVLGAFMWWELRVKEPMLNLRWFSDRALAIGSLGMMLMFFALFGVFFVISLFFQLVLGYSPLEAGIRLLPLSFFMVAVTPITPRLVTRFGANRVVGVGMAVVAGAFVLFSFVGPDSTYLVVVTVLCLMASGMALTMAPLTTAIMSGVPRTKAGVGSALNDATRELGGALGVAVLGSLISARYTSGVSGAVADLPGPARATAESSLAGALSVAGGLGEGGRALADVARGSFVDGMGVALLVGAVLIALTAIASWRFLPAQLVETDHVPVPDTDPAGRSDTSFDAERLGGVGGGDGRDGDGQLGDGDRALPSLATSYAVDAAVDGG